MRSNRWGYVVVGLLFACVLPFMVASSRGAGDDQGAPLDGFVVTSIDDDHDGVFEAYKMMMGDDVVLFLRDGNQDGHLDEWVFYESGDEKILVGDRDYDGRPDVYRLWTAERRGVTARDLDHDGMVDKKSEFYTKVSYAPTD
ncbi:MAG: hypothetical protein ACE5IK_04130 [Acidobacteriota bacterium]